MPNKRPLESLSISFYFESVSRIATELCVVRKSGPIAPCNGPHGQAVQDFSTQLILSGAEFYALSPGISLVSIKWKLTTLFRFFRFRQKWKSLTTWKLRDRHVWFLYQKLRFRILRRLVFVPWRSIKNWRLYAILCKSIDFFSCRSRDGIGFAARLVQNAAR